MKLFALAASLLFLSCTVVSCIQDECADTICQNGGICVLGNCSCLNGYEGSDCSEVWNNRFLGQWIPEAKRQQPADIASHDSFAVAKFSLTETSFIPNGHADQFLIENIGFLDSILCRRLNYYEFSLAEDQFIDSSITILSGSGFLDSSGKFIQLTYTTQIRNSVSTHLLTWHRKD